MKPIYKSLALAAMTLQVSLGLNAQAYDGTTTSDTALPAEVLDSLRVELVDPNVSGARDLIKSGECTIDGSDLSVTLNAANWVKGATYRVQVVATFGTQTQVIYALYVTVPYYVALSDTPQEYEDTVTVVSTVGGASGGGADATVYALNEGGSACITTPLSVGDGAAATYGAIAGGYVLGENSFISAGGTGSIASGYVNGENSYIEAIANGTIAIGCASGDDAIIQASSEGAMASGYADGNGASIQASGAGAMASGYADGIHGDIEASGFASYAFGIGVKATQEAQMVVGKCNVVSDDDSYQFIVGNGEDDENRSNAFAITKSGELALFESDGTPVILTAADLKALIASLQ